MTQGTIEPDVHPRAAAPDRAGPALEPQAPEAPGPTASASRKAPARKRQQKRLASVDAFRGLTIFGMLLVNNVALGRWAPPQLEHAKWGHGVHFADMVFPWFLLIVGLSIPLAAASHRRRGLGREVWVFKVFTRTFMLVLLGCLVDSSIKGHLVFCLGVLQLIGLSYCVAALLADLSQVGRLVAAAVLFTLHWAVVCFYPVPGLGAGVITESQNFVVWLNEAILKQYHLDGLFSMVSTSALVIVGTIMGDALRREEGITIVEIGYLFISGAVLAGIGWAVSFHLVYSKPLWTTSYLLFTGGCGLMVLSFFRLTVDMTRLSGWAYPLLVFGANAITVYVVPILLKMLVFQKSLWPMANGTWHTWHHAYFNWCVDTMQPHVLSAASAHYWGGWVYTVSYIALWWFVLLLMYRNKLFVRV